MLLSDSNHREVAAGLQLDVWPVEKCAAPRLTRRQTYRSDLSFHLWHSKQRAVGLKAWIKLRLDWNIYVKHWDSLKVLSELSESKKGEQVHIPASDSLPVWLWAGAKQTAQTVSGRSTSNGSALPPTLWKCAGISSVDLWRQVRVAFLMSGQLVVAGVTHVHLAVKMQEK